MMTLDELLNRYLPVYEEEQKAKENMLHFLRTHPDCFERSCIPGHFTGSAWLLNKEQTHALLLHHKKLNKWLQLGGHCDGDSDVLAVAIREAQEESGIMGIAPLSTGIFDIDIHTIPARKEEPEHLHLDVRFLLTVTSDEVIIKNEESLALQWFSKTDPHFPNDVNRMVEKWNRF